MMNYNFAFGSPLKKVNQQDISKKKVFILGVYASGVHAKWLDQNGKIIVQALAVASEPNIFWRGDNADQIVNNIKIPAKLGTLIPANKNLNGPSGRALDSYYLAPLGLSRDDVWLCDLLPYSRINKNQANAISEHYTPIIAKYNLNNCTIPRFNEKELNKPDRPGEIMEELRRSEADTIILLGDAPIKWFLSKVFKTKQTKLSDFGKSDVKYGKYHWFDLGGYSYRVLPLVHPRQSGKLGRFSKEWNQLHENWFERTSLMTSTPVYKAFETKPKKWGLRGDPFLWFDMQEYMAITRPPQSADEFKELFFQAIEKLVGSKLIAGKDYTVDKYAHGGMSSGMISGDFWLNKALPMLKQKIGELKIK